MDMDKLVALCKRRGFIFQSSEIYGGINGFWDYGPLGVELKNNIKQAWWQDMVRNPPPGPDGDEITMVGLDCSIIMNPKVWEASGHVGGFADPMVDCKECKGRFRADALWSVTWANYDRFLLFFAADKFDDLPAIDEMRAIAAARKGWAELTPAEQRTFREILNIRELRDAEHPPVLQKTVEAGSYAEAQDLAALTNREAKELGSPFVLDAARVLERSEALASLECPKCHVRGKLTEPRQFNLMFKTTIGAVEDPSAIAYLRPETAQGIFVNFKNVLDSTRVKLPFGIAQVGKAFRNEINPRNYTFRSREFEQMEIEFFCHPVESMKWYEYWRDVRKRWYTQLGIQSDKLRPRDQGKEELAHYSMATTDIEYLFPFSDEPQELEGVAHRGDFDLKAHQAKSGKDLSYFDEEAWERDKASRGTNSFKEWLKTNPPQEEIQKYQFIPHVVEPSAGADRFTLAVLCEAYAEDTVGGEARTVMRFHPRLAPIKAAVLPLVNRDGMPEKARALYRELKRQWNVFYDDKGAIGRRYRRQDEAGTPYCLTIDGQTLHDDTVTLRDRDTCEQVRVKLNDVAEELKKRLEAGS